MENILFQKFSDSLVRISRYEFEAIDPATKGKWVVKCNLPLNEMMALHAIGTQRSEQDAAPGEGTTATINLQIKIGHD